GGPHAVGVAADVVDQVLKGLDERDEDVHEGAEERAERVGADVGGETGDVGDRGEDLHGPAGDVGLALGHAPDRGLDVVRLAEERHAGGAGARVEDVAFGVVLGGQGGEVGGVLD